MKNIYGSQVKTKPPDDINRGTNAQSKYLSDDMQDRADYWSTDSTENNTQKNFNGFHGFHGSHGIHGIEMCAADASEVMNKKQETRNKKKARRKPIGYEFSRSGINWRVS